jgi:hypothetical protein
MAIVPPLPFADTPERPDVPPLALWMLVKGFYLRAKVPGFYAISYNTCACRHI